MTLVMVQEEELIRAVAAPDISQSRGKLHGEVGLLAEEDCWRRIKKVRGRGVGNVQTYAAGWSRVNTVRPFGGQRLTDNSFGTTNSNSEVRTISARQNWQRTT